MEDDPIYRVVHQGIAGDNMHWCPSWLHRLYCSSSDGSSSHVLSNSNGSECVVAVYITRVESNTRAKPPVLPGKEHVYIGLIPQLDRAH